MPSLTISGVRTFLWGLIMMPSSSLETEDVSTESECPFIPLIPLKVGQDVNVAGIPDGLRQTGESRLGRSVQLELSHSWKLLIDFEFEGSMILYVLVYSYYIDAFLSG